MGLADGAGGLEGGINSRLKDNIAGNVLVFVGEGDCVGVWESTVKGEVILIEQINEIIIAIMK